MQIARLQGVLDAVHSLRHVHAVAAVYLDISLNGSLVGPSALKLMTLMVRSQGVLPVGTAPAATLEDFSAWRLSFLRLVTPDLRP